jgi:hypothetical protein
MLVYTIENQHLTPVAGESLVSELRGFAVTEFWCSEGVCRFRKEELWSGCERTFALKKDGSGRRRPQKALLLAVFVRRARAKCHELKSAGQSHCKRSGEGYFSMV